MITRVKKVGSFTRVDNHYLEDDRLSFRAKGVLTYLLSKPDDWKVREKHLVIQSTEGKQALAGATKELRERGFLHTYRVRDAKGQFSTLTDVYETPALNPHFGTPEPGNPDHREPGSGSPEVGEAGSIVTTDTSSTEVPRTEERTTEVDTTEYSESQEEFGEEDQSRIEQHLSTLLESEDFSAIAQFVRNGNKLPDHLHVFHAEELKGLMFALGYPRFAWDDEEEDLKFSNDVRARLRYTKNLRQEIVSTIQELVSVST